MYRKPEDEPFLIIVDDKSVAAIDAATGEEAWRRVLDDDGFAISRMLIDGDFIYIARATLLCCLRYTTGETLWGTRLAERRYDDRLVNLALLRHRGRLFHRGFGRVSALDVSSGEVLWQRAMSSSLVEAFAFGFPGDVNQADV